MSSQEDSRPDDQAGNENPERLPSGEPDAVVEEDHDRDSSVDNIFEALEEELLWPAALPEFNSLIAAGHHKSAERQIADEIARRLVKKRDLETVELGDLEECSRHFNSRFGGRDIPYFLMQIGDRLSWFSEQRSHAYSCIIHLLRRFSAGEDCLPTDVFEEEAVSRYTWWGLGTATLSCCRLQPVVFDLVSIMERAADEQKALAALEAYASGLMGQQNALATLLGYPDVESLRSAENEWGKERPI